MNIDEAINRLSNCHPITKEDQEAFECAVHCMEFTRDFIPLGATSERMENALQLLNSLEYAMTNVNYTGGNIYFTSDPDGLKKQTQIESKKLLKELRNI